MHLIELVKREQNKQRHEIQIRFNKLCCYVGSSAFAAHDVTSSAVMNLRNPYGSMLICNPNNHTHYKTKTQNMQNRHRLNMALNNSIQRYFDTFIHIVSLFGTEMDI